MADLATGELAAMSYKAVYTFKNAMDNPDQPKLEIALRAAESTLDRIGAGKRTSAEIEIKGPTPVILLPAKDSHIEAVDVYVQED